MSQKEDQSTSSVSSKQAAILVAAKTLFWKHGIRRVSVKEICATAKVSKMTFYRFFENKAAVAKTLLMNLFEEGRQQYREIMTSSNSFEEKMQQTLQLKLANNQGLSHEFIADIYQNESLGLLGFLEKEGEHMLKEFLSDCQQAQQEGHIRADIKLEMIIPLLYKMQELQLDPKVYSLYGSYNELTAELTRFLLYGLLERS